MSEITLNQIETLTKIVAFGAAALFVSYKVITGYFIINLTLKLSTERSRATVGDNDCLGVTVELIKGDRSSVFLRFLKLRVRQGDIIREFVHSDIFRADFDSKNPSWVNFDNINPKKPLYTISAGESTSFSFIVDGVPTSEPCMIEIIVLAEKSNFLSFLETKEKRLGQWRASAVALPIGNLEST